MNQIDSSAVMSIYVQRLTLLCLFMIVECYLEFQSPQKRREGPNRCASCALYCTFRWLCLGLHDPDKR